jgi:hypothetical protein
MPVKIESVPIEPVGNGGRGNGAFREFVFALRDLKKGQSFLWELSSNDRMAVSIVQMLLDRQFITRKQDNGKFRIGRIL